MSNRFTQKAQHALTQALATAQEMGHTYVGTEHILMGLLLTASPAESLRNGV